MHSVQCGENTLAFDWVLILWCQKQRIWETFPLLFWACLCWYHYYTLLAGKMHFIILTYHCFYHIFGPNPLGLGNSTSFHSSRGSFSRPVELWLHNSAVKTLMWTHLEAVTQHKGRNGVWLLHFALNVKCEVLESCMLLVHNTTQFFFV